MKYKRILLKLSGEALGGADGTGIDHSVTDEYAKQIKEISDAGCQIAIVIGGGNIFRGLEGTGEGYDRVKGDQMGMLATVINSLALESALNRAGCKTLVFTSIRMEPVGRFYNRDKADKALKEGYVCLLAGGTGNPFFTTDSAAALRSVELRCDVLLKGTRVDGVYDSDPEKNPSAIKYETVKFDEVIAKKLRVMDITAFAMCSENNMPIIVFNMNQKGTLARVIEGKNCGTLVSS
jgi:uridylate kinase